MPRKTLFQRKHKLEYGLRVAEIDPVTTHVKSVSCQFCAVFRREEKVGAKRKATAHVKYFKAPFRVEGYRQHHEGQHPTRWEEYRKLGQDKALLYFSELSEAPIKNTVRAYFGGRQAPLVEDIDAPIVDILIAEMLFDADTEETTIHHALKPFEMPEVVEDDGSVKKWFTVTLKNPLQFHCSIDYLAVGCSFRQSAEIFMATKERTGMASMGSLHQGVVAKYAQICCAINFMRLKMILEEKCWTFSVALDMSNHLSTGYLDIRVRIYVHGKIENFHVVSLPIHGVHTGAVMFDAFQRFFDVLCPSWKRKVLSCASNGEAKMTGWISGFVTRMENVALPGFIRIWCAAHQLDIVMHRFYAGLLDEKFYRDLTWLIGFLRRQQKFEESVGSTMCAIASIS